MEEFYHIIDLINEVVKLKGSNNTYVAKPTLIRRTGFSGLKTLTVELYKLCIENNVKVKTLLITFEYKGMKDEQLYNSAVKDILNLFMKDDV